MTRIRKPTLRKVRNRGLVPIRYHMYDKRGKEITSEFRHGWIESDDGEVMRIRLIGEDRVRRITGRDRAYVRAL